MCRKESCYFETEFYSAGLYLTYCNGDDYEMPSSKFLSRTHGSVKPYSPTINNISKPAFTNTEFVVALRRR